VVIPDSGGWRLDPAASLETTRALTLPIASGDLADPSATLPGQTISALGSLDLEYARIAGSVSLDGGFECGSKQIVPIAAFTLSLDWLQR
jgi:hypothetical protein